MKNYLYPIFVFDGKDLIEYGKFDYQECFKQITDFQLQGYCCFYFKGAWISIKGY